MKIFKMSEYLNENKMWYKTIPEILSFLESYMTYTWIYLDTETTGLGGPKMQQLTQIAAISVNPKTNKLIDNFNQKIEIEEDFNKILDDDIFPDRKWSRRDVLKFNHYADNMNGKKYLPEQEVLTMFTNWVETHKNPLYVIQNAEFDMSMLGGRSKNKLNKIPVLDTKMFLQLYIIPLYQVLAESDDQYVKKLEKIGTSSRDNGLISSSMSVWSSEFGIDKSGYHDALFDCEMTIKMFNNMIELLNKHKSLNISKYQHERIETYK